MSEYTLEYKQTSNSSPRSNFGAAAKPTAITIHHWGADGQSHDAVVAWLRGIGNPATSAHYVVSGKRVTQLEKDTRATWHAGHRTGNGISIGIEMRPEMTTEDWNTLVQLCADLEEEHGSLKYYKHSDWKATACPGRYGNRMGELVKAVNAEHARRGGNKGGKPATGGRPSTGNSDTTEYRKKKTKEANVDVYTHRDSGNKDRIVDQVGSKGYRLNVVDESGSWTRIRWQVGNKGDYGNYWVATADLEDKYEDEKPPKNVRPEDSIRRICIRATEGTEDNSTGHLIGLYQIAQLDPFPLHHDQHWGEVTDQHYRWVHRLQVEMNKWKGSNINENGNYNAATHSRVRDLQQRNHGGAYKGVVDGVAGPVFCKMLGVNNYPN